MADALAAHLARALALTPEEAEQAVARLTDEIRRSLAADGAAHVEALGTFRLEGGELAFEPDATLAQAVNHRYAGLPPVPASTPEPAPEPEPDPFGEPERPAPERPAPETPSEPDPIRDLRSDAPSWEPVPDEPGGETSGEARTSDEATEGGEGGAATADEQGAEGEHVEAEAEGTREAFEDDPLEGVWTPPPDTLDEDHPLGPMPPAEIEDADYSVVGADEEAEDDPATAEEDEEALEAPAFVAPTGPLPADASAGEPRLDPLPSDPSPVGAGDPPPVRPPLPPGAEREEEAPVVVAKPDAPPPPHALGREPAPSRRGWIAALGALLLAAVIALTMWFAQREPEPLAGAPPPERVEDARPPTPAAAQPPAGAAAPAEGQADPPAAEPEAEPETPLRGAAGPDPARGGYTWVVASEPVRADAERLARRYRAGGLRAGVIAATINGQEYFRVGLGQFATQAEANRYRRDLPADAPAETWLLQL